MVWRSLLVWSSLVLAGFHACLAATRVEKIRNQKVIVTEEALAPGETASLPDDRPSMVVYLTGDLATVISGHGRASQLHIKRGETSFLTAQAESIKNESSTTLSFVQVEFLTAGNPETWGMTGLAPNYKILLENPYARAYEIKIPAQSFEPQHTHHDRVVVCLSGAELEHILPSGEKQPSTLKTGDVVWRLGSTHIGHNMGQTDLWVIAIEPK